MKRRLFLASLLALSTAANAATFTVNSTQDDSDTTPGDGICSTVNNNCTLRAAIEESNANPGNDKIRFNISTKNDTGCNATTKVCTIRPSNTYSIFEQLKIDGYSQKDSKANTLPDDQGLNTILKLVIHAELQGDNLAVFDLQDHRGSEITGLAITNTFISSRSNRGTGISVFGQDKGNEPGHKFTGIFLGTDEQGLTTVGDLIRGIQVQFADNIQIGGTDPKDRNLIMSIGDGGRFRISSNLNISGNLIGTDITGMNATGLTASCLNFDGVIYSSIGSPAGGRNVCSGVATGAAFMIGFASQNNIIQNNLIGTNIANQAFPASEHGIWTFINSNNNLIGGSGLEQNNTISASGDGIRITDLANTTSSNNLIQGNYIGINSQGNALSSGINGIIVNGQNNVIGGINEGEGNQIANFDHGIVIADHPALVTSPSAGHTISGNNISNSNLLGIDLLQQQTTGITINDNLDIDNGANGLQNFPRLLSATTQQINGEFNSEASTDYRIEFFANNTCNLSGYGDGEQFLGHVDIATDNQGNAVFSAPISALAGRFLTATATNLSSGNTSEFSECLVEVVPVVCSDSDGDSVCDDSDLCPNTFIPETPPTQGLSKNHYALIDSDLIFDAGPGTNNNSVYTIADTQGCSCEQLLSMSGRDNTQGCKANILN